MGQSGKTCTYRAFYYATVLLASLVLGVPRVFAQPVAHSYGTETKVDNGDKALRFWGAVRHKANVSDDWAMTQSMDYTVSAPSGVDAWFRLAEADSGLIQGHGYRRANGLELAQGYVYVKIADVSATNQPLLEPSRIAQLAYENVDLAAPIIERWIATQDNAAELLRQLDALHETGEVLENVRNLDITKLADIALRTPVDGVGILNVADEQFIRQVFQTAGQRQAFVDSALLLQAASADRMVEFGFEGAYFPFVIGKRSSGGAEGTDIVVYCTPDAANTGTVQTPVAGDMFHLYYFFVQGTISQKIRVTAHQWIADADEEVDTELSLCQYIHLQIKYVDPDGAGAAPKDWYLPSNISIDNQKDAIANATPALKNLIKEAHDKAKAAGTIDYPAYPCGL